MTEKRGGEMKVHTNLLSQLLQLVLGLAAKLLDVSTCACFNLHLGASVFQLGLQEFANVSIFLKKIKETINIYIYIYIYISAEDESRYNEGGKVEDISYSLD